MCVCGHTVACKVGFTRIDADPVVYLVNGAPSSGSVLMKIYFLTLSAKPPSPTFLTNMKTILASCTKPLGLINTYYIIGSELAPTILNWPLPFPISLAIVPHRVESLSLSLSLVAVN